MNNEQAFVFGLVGKTLNHSFSKQYFQHKFDTCGINAKYENFELSKIDKIKDVFILPSLKGLNITIPYKTAIIPFLNELTEEAKIIGAVNTIIIDGQNRIGANTDAFGFHQMIKPFLLNTHERALILGNGGASIAIVYVLKKIGLEVVVAARNPKKGQFHLNQINDVMFKHCGVVVNCTPIGTFPDINQSLELPYLALNENHLVVDLVYNPAETQFMKNAKKQGAVTLNGLTMLHQQAEKSWQLWMEKMS